MNNILVDTNVLIYAFDETSDFYEKAAEVMQNEDLNLFVTTKNISEFFAVCSKLKLNFAKTLGFYQDLKNNVEIIKPTDQSLNYFEILIQKYQPKGNQVYDIEIASMMLAHDIKSIATANTKDFINVTEIEIYNLSQNNNK